MFVKGALGYYIRYSICVESYAWDLQLALGWIISTGGKSNQENVKKCHFV